MVVEVCIHRFCFENNSPDAFYHPIPQPLCFRLQACSNRLFASFFCRHHQPFYIRLYQWVHSSFSGQHQWRRCYHFCVRFRSTGSNINATGIGSYECRAHKKRKHHFILLRDINGRRPYMDYKRNNKNTGAWRIEECSLNHMMHNKVNYKNHCAGKES